MKHDAIPLSGEAVPAVGPDERILCMAFEAEQLAIQAEHIRHTRYAPADKAYEALTMALDARGVAFDSAGWNDAMKLFEGEHGRVAANEEIGDLYCRSTLMIEELIATPAKTQAGRAAKVRAWLKRMADHDWLESLADGDHEQVLLLEMLSEYSGVSALMLAVGTETAGEDVDRVRRYSAARAA
jgi:hypothetical protein